MSRRECRGSERGLAGLPQAATEFSEGYFSSQGVLPEKCGVNPNQGSPAYRTRTGIGTQIIYGYKEQQGFCPPRRDDWMQRAS